MIKLPIELYEKMLDTARKGRPEEVCGLIGGTEFDDARTVKEIYILENIDHSSRHFSMNPKEQFAAVRDMRSRGIVPLGNFHSHPTAPSRPSDEDKRLAFDKNASYMILSLMDNDKPVLKSFRIADNVSEEDIEYI